MGQRHPVRIKAPGVSRGIAHRRTRDPVAYAQGLYGAGANPLARAQRLADGGRVHRKRQARREHVDEVVEHEVAEGGGEEVVAELRIGGDGDLGPVAGLRVLAGGDRDGDADEVQGVAGGVGDIVAFVDPPQFVEVVEIPREVVEVDRRLEADGV